MIFAEIWKSIIAMHLRSFRQSETNPRRDMLGEIEDQAEINSKPSRGIHTAKNTFRCCMYTCHRLVILGGNQK